MAAAIAAAHHEDDCDVLEHQRRELARYRHEYVVTDPSQVLPQFIVQFTEGDDADDDSGADSDGSGSDAETGSQSESEQDRRTSTESSPASEPDGHGGGRPLSEVQNRRAHARRRAAAKRHVKRKGGYGTCPHHKSTAVEYFCQLCHMPVCVHCKMVGSHSAGEAAHHALIGIEDAYDAALESSRREDPLLASRKDSLHEALSAVRGKSALIAANASAVEELIVQKMHEALDQLRRLTRRKATVLLAEELELLRQLDHFDWVESFLAEEKESLSPVDFLAAWSRHAALRTQLHGTGAGVRDGVDKVLTKVMPDLHVAGHVEVLTGGTGSNRVSFARTRRRSSQAGGRTSHGGRSSGAGDGSEMSAEAIIAGLKRDIRVRDAAAEAMAAGVVPGAPGGGLVGGVGAASPGHGVLIGSPIPQMMSPPGTYGIGSGTRSAGGSASGARDAAGSAAGGATPASAAGSAAAPRSASQHPPMRPLWAASLPDGLSAKQFWTNVIKGKMFFDGVSGEMRSTDDLESRAAEAGYESGDGGGAGRARGGVHATPDAIPRHVRRTTGWMCGSPYASPVPLAGLPTELTPDRGSKSLPRALHRKRREIGEVGVEGHRRGVAGSARLGHKHQRQGASTTGRSARVQARGRAVSDALSGEGDSDAAENDVAATARDGDAAPGDGDGSDTDDGFLDLDDDSLAALAAEPDYGEAALRRAGFTPTQARMHAEATAKRQIAAKAKEAAEAARAKRRAVTGTAGSAAAGAASKAKTQQAQLRAAQRGKVPGKLGTGSSVTHGRRELPTGRPPSKLGVVRKADSDDDSAPDDEASVSAAVAAALSSAGGGYDYSGSSGDAASSYWSAHDSSYSGASGVGSRGGARTGLPRSPR